MPDHPSWPAELVEKGTTAIHDVMVRCFQAKPNTEENMAAAAKMALGVLSALSGDLVPRSQAVVLTDDHEVCDGQLTAARSQADALAEALEEYAEQIERDRREPDKMLCVVLSMRRSAASYRSSSSTETEG